MFRAAGIRDYRKEQAKWRRATMDLLRASGLVDKHGRIKRREPVLPPAARAYAKKIVESRRLSIKFLKEAGIIERPRKARASIPLSMDSSSGESATLHQ